MFFQQALGLETRQNQILSFSIAGLNVSNLVIVLPSGRSWNLKSRFATDAARRGFLAMIRWPQGPCCSASRPVRKAGRRDAAYECVRLAGTNSRWEPLSHDAGVPALWWVSSRKNGTGGLGLKRVLVLGSYRTAWTWLQKLRRAMVRPVGTVADRHGGEVDEAFVGSAEVRSRAIDRIRLRRVSSFNTMEKSCVNATF